MVACRILVLESWYYIVIIMHLRLCIMAHSRVPRGGGCFDANIRTAFTADSIESIYSEIGIDVR
jgi:hypothetical protein